MWMGRVSGVNPMRQVRSREKVVGLMKNEGEGESEVGPSTSKPSGSKRGTHAYAGNDGLVAGQSMRSISDWLWIQATTDMVLAHTCSKASN
nr:hypothetical protein CFP56_78671 [Quercus suber]